MEEITHKNCKNIKFYVTDINPKKTINKETGHLYNKSEQLPVCQISDEYILCRRICKNFITHTKDN